MSAHDPGATALPAELAAAPAPRLLVVADQAIADLTELPPLLRGIIDRAGEVYVVTPTLPGRLDWLASRINPARHAADERLGSLLGQLHAIGVQADGRTGDDDILTAFADAVADFGPDHILVALRGSDHSNWQERGLIAQVRDQFQVPVTSFALDTHGHLPPRAAPQARLRAAPLVAEPVDRVEPLASTSASPELAAPVERDGMPVLLLFLVASLIMVAGIWFASEIDSMWVLAPVVAVDFILIAAVTTGVYGLINDDAQANAPAPGDSPAKDQGS